MKKSLQAVALFVMMGLVGCTDATMAKFDSLGNKSHIACYSGGVPIYEGVSSGKVSNEQNSDGYFFQDKETGRLMEVGGDCVITTLND